MQRLQSDRSIAPLAAQFVPVKIVSNSDTWAKWATKHPPQASQVRTPLLCVVRADGKTLDYHEGAPQGNDLQVYLRRQLAAAGRTFSLGQADALSRMVETARVQWEKGDRQAAIKTLVPLRKLGPPGKLGSYAEPAVAADKLVNEWIQEFRDSMDEIKSRLGKEPLPALVDFVVLEDAFRGFEPVKLELAKTRKTIRRAADQRERLRAAEVIVKARKRLESGKSAASSLGALRKLADTSADPEAAKIARELLEKIGTAAKPKSTAAYRTWRDRSGKYEVVARFVRLEGDQVILRRKSDGKRIAVPLARLAETDQHDAKQAAAADGK